MPRITARRTIRAAPDLVFRTVTDVENLPQVVPEVLHVEFLSEWRSGVGTRFRETRRSGRNEMATDLEITEFVEGAHVRMVAVSHGTTWDTTFTIAGDGDRSELTLTMDARAERLLPRLMTFLFQGLFRRGLVRYCDAVQAYCEGERSPSD